MHLGGLFNVNFGGLGNGGFHWAVGPVIRGMFQSVTDDQRTLRIWNIDDDLYDAFTFGLRLALHQRSDANWMPTASIDISRGRFQNFEIANVAMTNGETQQDKARMCLKAPLQCLGEPLPENYFDIEEKWRTYVEGRVVIGNLYLGFDLNNGHGHDDLRFVAGATFSLSTLFSGQD